jgi:ATP synthase protein I
MEPGDRDWYTFFVTPPTKDDSGLSNTARAMRDSQPYLSAVWKLVGGAVFGVGAGYFLDRWLHTTPWLLVALSVLGISVGFYAFLKAMLSLGKKP